MPSKTQVQDLDAVVLRYISRLYRVARQLTGNPQAAEDLVGQTLFQASKAWHTFDGRHPEAWLIRVLTRLWYKAGSSQKRIRESECLFHDSIQSPIDVHQIVMSRMNAEMVRECLGALSEDHRAILTLCDIEQMKYIEVSYALGIPKGTVASRLSRARAALHAEITRRTTCD